MKIKEEREKKKENERGRMKEISEGGRKKNWWENGKGRKVNIKEEEKWKCRE